MDFQERASFHSIPTLVIVNKHFDGGSSTHLRLHPRTRKDAKGQGDRLAGGGRQRIRRRVFGEACGVKISKLIPR